MGDKNGSFYFLCVGFINRNGLDILGKMIRRGGSVGVDY